MKPHTITEAEKEVAREHIYAFEISVFSSTRGACGGMKRLSYMVGPATYRVYHGNVPVGYSTLEAAIEAYNDLG